MSRDVFCHFSLYLLPLQETIKDCRRECMEEETKEDFSHLDSPPPPLTMVSYNLRIQLLFRRIMKQRRPFWIRLNGLVVTRYNVVVKRLIIFTTSYLCMAMAKQVLFRSQISLNGIFTIVAKSSYNKSRSSEKFH